MKKIIVILITSLLFVGGVSAKKTIVKTCHYQNRYDMPLANLNADVNVYDDNSYKVKIYVYNHQDVKSSVSSESGKEFDPITPTRLEQGKCPNYLYVKYTNTGVTPYLVDTLGPSSCKDKCIYAETSDNSLSQDEIDEGNKLIDNAIATLKEAITYYKNFDITSSECYKPTTNAGYEANAPYKECIENIERHYFTRSGNVKKVESMADANDYWKDNQKIKELEKINMEFESAYDMLHAKLEKGEAEEHLKYWQSVNAATGTDQYASYIKKAQEALKEKEDRLNALYKLEQDKEGNSIDEKNCEGLIGPNTLEFLRILRNIVMIAGPILAVILGTYDMIRAMASGEDDAKKKGLKRLKGRLIAAALLLLAPYIIFLLIQISPAVGKDCINQVSYIVSDTINILK